MSKNTVKPALTPKPRKRARRQVENPAFDAFARRILRAYARRVAAGPTVAHAATKQLVTTAVRQGARVADDLVPGVSGALFATDDLRGAVASFLADGPGKASYAGR